MIARRQLRPVLRPSRASGRTWPGPSGHPRFRLVELDIRDGEARRPARRRGPARRDRPPRGPGGGPAEHRGPGALRRGQRRRDRPPARGRLPARAAAAVRLRLQLERLRRPARRPVPRDRPGRPPGQPLRGDQEGVRAAGPHLPPPPRPARHRPPLLHRLRPEEPARPGDRQVRPPDRPGRAGPDVRRRHDPPRLHLRRGHRRRDRPGRRPLPTATTSTTWATPTPIELRDDDRRPRRGPGQARRIRHLPEQPGDVRQTYADISLARAELGYDPKTRCRGAGPVRRVVAVRGRSDRRVGLAPGPDLGYRSRQPDKEVEMIRTLLALRLPGDLLRLLRRSGRRSTTARPTKAAEPPKQYEYRDMSRGGNANFARPNPGCDHDRPLSRRPDSGLRSGRSARYPMASIAEARSARSGRNGAPPAHSPAADDARRPRRGPPPPGPRPGRSGESSRATTSTAGSFSRPGPADTPRGRAWGPSRPPWRSGTRRHRPAPTPRARPRRWPARSW